MIFKSNISAPDLAPHFRLLSKPRPWSFGHDVPSDPDYEPECGFMTHDEAAILYECARRVGGYWADIGSRFGWTSAHIAAAGVWVHAVDPIYSVEHLTVRTEENTEHATGPHQGILSLVPVTSSEFWRELDGGHWISTGRYDGICIDGNHDRPEPLNDAMGAFAHLSDPGIVVFHDFWGQPVREGAEFLMKNGFKCRVYYTPNGMAVCWRGDFTPPVHVPDPQIKAAITAERLRPFPLGRCA